MPEEADASMRENSSSARVVMIVEDSFLVAHVIIGMLDELGFETRHAVDVAEALKILGQEQVRLILSDIELPGPMDGHSFALDLRETRPEIPVLLMTGHVGKAARAQKDFDVLTKPFTAEDLRVLLSKALQTSGSLEAE